MRMTARRAIHAAHDDHRDATIARLTAENETLAAKNAEQTDTIIELTGRLMDLAIAEQRRVNDELIAVLARVAGAPVPAEDAPAV